MKKSQLLILIAGVIAVIFLFTLPKVIVKNEKESPKSGDQHENPASKQASVPSEHKVEISKKDQEKIELLRKALHSAADNEKKCNFADSLAELYRDLLVYDSAAKYFAEEVKLKPTKENLIKTGDAYFDAFSFYPEAEGSAEKVAEARTYYTKALEQAPKDLAVKNKISTTYIGTNDAMAAVTLLREIIREEPKNKQALYSLGILSIRSGQFDKGVGRFETIIKNYPEEAPAYLYLGICYLNLGDKEKAKGNFLKAKELDNDEGFRATVDSYLKELK